MKLSDIEDAGLLVTKTELREAMLSLHEDLLGIKNQILAMNNQISDLREVIRTKWWIPVAVTLIGTVGTIIAAAIIAHHR
jgi:hypothetical protein